MSCDCPNCKRDNILNGTLTADCFLCSTKLDINVKFQIMPDKTLVCDKCVTEHYVLCNGCKKLHKKGTLKTVSRQKDDGSTEKIEVCEKCFLQNYRECGECHNYFDRHDVMGHGDKCYCKPCFTKSYQQCSHCSHVFPKGQVTHTIRGTHLVCDPCFNWYGPIELYEKKPTLAFHGTPPHYYGVELECELVNAKREERGAKAKEVMDLFPKDFAVLKEDGSIRCGFEICSQPATVTEHRRIWTPFFDKLPTNLHSFNTSNCGLHIHCSKKPLSLLTIAKIVVFVNDEKNQPFVETMAGRKSNTYSCYQKKEYGTVKRIGNIGRGDRYEAVNLVNKDTIEFRIFKGTLKRESFFKAIEFCDAMIRFCAMGAHGIAYCRDKQNFINFVVERQKDYPHLYAFICAKVLKQENKLTKAFGFCVEGLPQPTQQPTTTPVEQPTQQPQQTEQLSGMATPYININITV